MKLHFSRKIIGIIFRILIPMSFIYKCNTLLKEHLQLCKSFMFRNELKDLAIFMTKTLHSFVFYNNLCRNGKEEMSCKTAELRYYCAVTWNFSMEE